MLGLQEKVTPPTKLEMRQLCLEFYLNLFKYSHILISGQFDETLAIDKYVEEIHHIFTSMAETLTTISGVPLVTANFVNVDKQQWHKIRMVRTGLIFVRGSSSLEVFYTIDPLLIHLPRSILLHHNPYCRQNVW